MISPLLPRPVRPVAMPGRPTRPRRHRRWPWLALLALLLGGAAYVTLLAKDVWTETRAGQAALNSGVAALMARQLPDLSAARLARAQADFQQAERSFASAQRRLGGWGRLATEQGGFLPGPAAQLRSVGPALDLARQAARTAAALVAGLRPLALTMSSPATAAGHGGGTPGLLARLTGALEQGTPGLERAARELAATRAARKRLEGLPRLGALTATLAIFDLRAPQLDHMLVYLHGLPALLGAQGPRSYLLVYQDAADLRATGGFIGAAGLIILDHGRMAQIDYETTGAQTTNSLQLSGAQTGLPPMPLFYYRNLGSWQLRDANFWPDFPTSSAQIARLYTTATGRRLDGVVALGPAATADLLRALGPLVAPGYGDTVTDKNVEARVEYYAHDRPGAHADPHRKRFVVALSHAVIARLLASGVGRINAIIPQVAQALTNRDIMISVHDPLFARVARLAHWDGAVRDEPGDYLAVVDQNVTDSKLNPFVDQEIAYAVSRQANGDLESAVTVTYHNHTRHQTVWIARTYYADYLRVGVPQRSALHALEGYDDTFWPDELEGGRRFFAGGFEVPAEASRTVRLTYRVAAAALHGVTGYRLVVQKQPNSKPPLLSVRLTAGGRTWTARTRLTRDIVVSTLWDARPGPLTVRPAPVGLANALAR